MGCHHSILKQQDGCGFGHRNGWAQIAGLPVSLNRFTLTSELNNMSVADDWTCEWTLLVHHRYPWLSLLGFRSKDHLQQHFRTPPLTSKYFRVAVEGTRVQQLKEQQ